MNRPRWRWILCCLALDLWWRTQWKWAGDLFAWCILPDWLGHVDGQDTANAGDGEAPW